MGRKILWATLAAIGLMAVTGVGFATFTASGSATVNGTAGTLSFQFTNVHVTSSALAYGAEYQGAMVGCTSPTITTTGTSPATGQTLSISAADMSVGDWCAVTFTVQNTGNIPGTYTVGAGTTTGQSGCWQFLPSSGSGGTLSAGGTSSSTTIALEVADDNPTAGNSCEGTTGSVSVAISLTGIQIGEAGEPPGL